MIKHQWCSSISNFTENDLSLSLPTNTRDFYHWFTWRTVWTVRNRNNPEKEKTGTQRSQDADLPPASKSWSWAALEGPAPTGQPEGVSRRKGEWRLDAPRACLDACYPLGGFCDFKHISSTYRVPDTVFDTSPHEAHSPVGQMGDTYTRENVTWDRSLGGTGAI